MRNDPRMRHGEDGEPSIRLHTKGVESAATSLNANIGETLASITQRAYGINTPTNRAKITNANASLNGAIRIPK